LTKRPGCDTIQSQAEGRHTRVVEGEAFLFGKYGGGCPGGNKRKTKSYKRKSLTNARACGIIIPEREIKEDKKNVLRS